MPAPPRLLIAAPGIEVPARPSLAQVAVLSEEHGLALLGAPAPRNPGLVGALEAFREASRRAGRPIVDLCIAGSLGEVERAETWAIEAVMQGLLDLRAADVTILLQRPHLERRIEAWLLLARLS